MNISEIFEEEPIQWGLRGDPWLWRELRFKFESVPMPETSVALKELIEIEYELCTGHSISYKKNFGIKRFNHGGMSGGGINPDFWIKKGIPLLVSRHIKP
jgi:hypothetical protein